MVMVMMMMIYLILPLEAILPEFYKLNFTYWQFFPAEANNGFDGGKGDFHVDQDLNANLFSTVRLIFFGGGEGANG